MDNPNNICTFNGKIVVDQNTIASKTIILPKGIIKTLDKAEGFVKYVSKEAELDIKPGDYIVYGKYAAVAIPDECEDSDENLHILDEGSILYKKDAPSNRKEGDNK